MLEELHVEGNMQATELIIKNKSVRKISLLKLSTITHLRFDPSCASVRKLVLSEISALEDPALSTIEHLENLQILQIKKCPKLHNPEIHSGSLKKLRLVRSCRLPSIICSELWILKCVDLPFITENFESIQNFFEGLSAGCPNLRYFSWKNEQKISLPADPSLINSAGQFFNWPFLERFEVEGIPMAWLNSLGQVFISLFIISYFIFSYYYLFNVVLYFVFVVFFFNKYILCMYLRLC